RVRIEDVQQVRNARTEGSSGLTNYFSRSRVAALRCLVDNLGGDLSQVPVNHAHDDRLGLISTQCFTRAFRDGGTGRVRLEASVVATLAAASSGIDRRVPDLS